MVTILILVIWLLALYLAIYKPWVFILIYGLVGCRYDAFGIGSYLSTYQSSHFIVFELLLILSAIISLVNYNRREYKSIIIFSVIFCLGILVSTILYGIFGDFNFSSTQILSQCIYNLANYGPLVLIVLLASKDKYDLKKLLYRYAFFQIFIAFLVVYLPIWGINVLDNISGAKYVSEGIYGKDISNLSNFYEIFKNKYAFNGIGQFHNGNDLGFFGGVGILLGTNSLIQGKTKKWITNLFLIVVSFLIWTNSGMRAPLMGIMLAFPLYILMQKNIAKKIINMIIGFYILGILLMVPTVQDVVSYFILNKENVSYISRIELLTNGIEFLKDNWVIGAGGLLGYLTPLGIDPHELPVRISVLFGIGTGIVSFWLVFVCPIKYYYKNKHISFYSIALLLIAWLTALTNNYTCIVLFWMIYSTAITDNKCASWGPSSHIIRKIKFVSRCNH